MKRFNKLFTSLMIIIAASAACGQSITQGGVRIDGAHTAGNMVVFGGGGRSLVDVGVGFTEVTNAVNLAASAVQPTNTALAGASFALSGGVAVGPDAWAVSNGVSVGKSSQAESGGFSGGDTATSSGGAGAVGKYADARDGGFAGGKASTSYAGGAVGSHSAAWSGGAVGVSAVALGEGFAGGEGARIYDGGVALGHNATAELDAIQLGTGTNETEHTFQVYDWLVIDANGRLDSSRLPSTIGSAAFAETTDFVADAELLATSNTLATATSAVAESVVNLSYVVNPSLWGLSINGDLEPMGVSAGLLDDGLFEIDLSTGDLMIAGNQSTRFWQVSGSDIYPEVN